ncbi:c-type cytochrome [Pelagicoccus sp. SDUM812002]|uniref:c-type cytochrome n=1 Tax=Pelagicoccus sp. SDUM812002 TaxID=3041266 RepID=UPI00280FD52F|nr:c-type cytochrome [Pelagicoccus sp. SDUM812002]MDQ8187968.1 c-type cytochrome [Pelagicoccus sp. SDUM812002]
MDRSLTKSLFMFASLSVTSLSPANGDKVFASYCASCHGSDGAGLLGPNLTDPEILHGSSLPEIKAVIENGVPAKAMPAWSNILSDDEIDAVAKHVRSIMGTNLVGPNQKGKSTVTPFPEGTLDRPILLRTFMPTMGLPDSVFTHHDRGEATPKYSPSTGTFDPEETDPVVPGVPGAIAVNFGNSLSYCFDSTECRLLYAWSGPFLDMTNYWGAGEGGGRKRFAYQAEVMGPPSFITNGPPFFEGTPQFLGYKKVRGVPSFEYKCGELEVSLLIEPGSTAGEVVCTYRTNANKPLTVPLPSGEEFEIRSDQGKIRKGTLRLKAKQAQAFTLTITPRTQVR